MAVAITKTWIKDQLSFEGKETKYTIWFDEACKEFGLEFLLKAILKKYIQQAYYSREIIEEEIRKEHKHPEDVFNEVWDILIDNFDETSDEETWSDEDLKKITRQIITAVK